jgi:hypothetical protein
LKTPELLKAKHINLYVKRGNCSNLSSVWASEGASANLYFLVKDNTCCKKVESEDANLVKSISGTGNTKIDEATK